MLILVLLGMYFDAAVVFVTKSSLLFRLAVAILCFTLLSKKSCTNFELHEFFLSLKNMQLNALLY